MRRPSTLATAAAAAMALRKLLGKDNGGVTALTVANSITTTMEHSSTPMTLS